MAPERPLVIEGAGGLMVPLNETDFVIDLVKQLDARLVLVSRNYLGSINHSLHDGTLLRGTMAWTLRAGCSMITIWIMNTERLPDWSGYPVICFPFPLLDDVSKRTIREAAGRLEGTLRQALAGVSGHQGE